MKPTELGESLWRGEHTTEGQNPVASMLLGFEQVAPRVGFVSSMGNVGVLDTDDGLVLVDTGGFLFARQNFDSIRAWSRRRVHTAIYTHGHVDHAFGLGPFEEEARAQGWARPEVIAHEALPERFDRYRLTAGYNAVINRRQFQIRGFEWPTEYRYPDRTLHDQLELEVGGVTLHLRHDRGETDDHIWAWLPEQRVLFSGDLFIWASPNCGNPQKAQRYPRDWASALRRMAALGPELLLPGHGPPILGAARVRQALEESAELLETLVEQTLRLMNEGARLDDVLASVTVPERLLERPYLRPVYDEPEFVVRNLWRLYGGWWDGNPASLKPAREAALAREIAELAGGAGRLAARAEELREAGELALACHLVELAAQSAPDDAGVHAVRARTYRERGKAASSLMAQGIYAEAARTSEGKSRQRS
jgi:alkyl sulfatase BDS1-like metallo-beta-lactamase superfamily hydrolase